MKILTLDLIRAADAYTIKSEAIASADLMERAANACLTWLNDHYDVFTELTIFCGMGNNGGDGLAIARMWNAIGSPVKVIIIHHSVNKSKDFEINFQKIKTSNIPYVEVYSVDDIPEIKKESLIIDAILGSGLNQATEGMLAAVIQHINELENEVISIDIPSGLYCDQSNSTADAIVNANTTLSFELPKLAFMFPQNYQYVGKWKVLPIKLSSVFIEKATTKNILIDDILIKSTYKSRKKTAHKGDYGHALLICGSMGKMGAAILASKSCLRSGVGLLSIHCPKNGEAILQTAVPEAMTESDIHEKFFSCIHSISNYDVIGIGSGIGTDIHTQKALKDLLLQTKKPMLIDADAINILGENKEWLELIPANSILTPHFKEFERICRKFDNDFERNQTQRELSVKHQIYIVLKGAHTSITTPHGDCYFNNTGNPGMATAGSGDVLTGIITGLMAQKYDSLQASILGVYLHGLAGDIYAHEFSEESLVAGDLIKNIGKAWSKIQE
ncbi:MAG: NAD(P)H-hydrate dehydratase [Bacteroidales bacterium]